MLQGVGDVDNEFGHKLESFVHLGLYYFIAWSTVVCMSIRCMPRVFGPGIFYRRLCFQCMVVVDVTSPIPTTAVRKAIRRDKEQLTGKNC